MSEAAINENFNFSRADWTQYRSLERLCQRGGVSKKYLLPLVAKELIDNAWDACSSEVEYRIFDDQSLIVSDDGPGIDPASLERIFCVNRPLESTKLWRLPTRGALGNGLRIVTGALMAVEGSLTVFTRGHACQVIPNPHSGTSLVSMKKSGHQIRGGTCIRISLPGLDMTADPFIWAGLPGKPSYKGKTSFHWYTLDSLGELFWSVKDQSVRQMVSQFDGATGGVAGKISDEFLNRRARSLSKEEISKVLSRGKEMTELVNPRRLGFIGKRDGFVGYHKDFVDNDSIPVVLEIWGTPSTDDSLRIFFNHAAIPCETYTHRQKKILSIFLGSSGWKLDTGSSHPISLEINISTPYISTVNESKLPDFGRYFEFSFDGIRKVQKQCDKHSKVMTRPFNVRALTAKGVVLNNLTEAIAHTSGNGLHRYSIRQLYYAVRPIVQSKTGRELSYDNFTNNIIADYENEIGHDLPGITRDARGIIYHPHLRQEIQLGTLEIENYVRPPYYFNKVIYIEKEGIIGILKSDKWPERHDCAVMCSKGYASRAARDLIDLLPESQEPIQVFCVHDCDAAGTMIYQSLMEATKARPERKIAVINLGLDLEDVEEMGLRIERLPTVRDRKNFVIADYVPAEKREWFMKNRVELNEMTSPQLIDWLDRKMATYGHEPKVIPPTDLLMNQLRNEFAENLRSRILRDAWLAFDGEKKLDDQLAQLMKCQESESTLIYVQEYIAGEKNQCSWRQAVSSLVDKQI